MSAGGASETESDEDTSATVPQLPGRRTNNPDLGLHRLAFLEQAAYDHHAEKRRKRGSLFFRKKKDKSRKAAHAWQAAPLAGHCDWCARVIADAPALYCDHCTMTVHQNVCKDYIVECNKPKSSKTSVGKSLTTSSGKSSKRSSVSGQSQNSNSTSHVYNDEKDGSDHKHDQSNASDDAGATEWPEVYITPDQLGEEAILLGLGASEPDTWAAGAPKGLAKSIGDRETKRQEHIYELILTEKHHCLTIRLMQKMFAEGMSRLGVVSEAQVARMFPRLDELWALHAALLARLRARQRTAPRVASVADILADTFAPPAHHRLKAAYGTSPRIVSEAQVARMFPRLDELWALHAALLARLRARQRTAPRVASVADILADTFAPPAHHRLKAAYGTSPRIVSEAQVARMFPRLDELWALHAALLARLRARQRTAPRVASVADILADTFAPPAHHRLKAAYGTSPCVVSPRVASVADILADTFAPPAHHRLKAAYGTSPRIVSEAQVARMFPRLDELWALHAALLARLRARQRTAPRVASVADILADTFAPPAHHRLKAAYGTSPCVVSPRVASVADILADTFAPPAHHRLKAAYGTSPCVVSPRVASVADILADTFAPPAHHRLKAAYGTSPRIVSEAQVARMFPRLDELWALHAALLARLRARQRTAPRVASVADILADTFAPPAHHRLKAAYGTSPRIVSEAQVARMFPRLDELWALHAALLARLRARQRTAPRVASVADILADTFAPPAHHRLKAAYGTSPCVVSPRVASVADILADTFAPPAHHRLKAAYGTSPRIVSEAQVARMFPRLDELWALHAALLARLRARQRTAPRVASVADILADTFAPPAHHRLKAAYGTSPCVVSPRVASVADILADTFAPPAHHRLKAAYGTSPCVVSPRVASVADILADTFAPPAHHRLKAAYGTSPRIVSEAQVARMFPRLDELWALHAALLARLRARQRTAPRVASVADILADTFAPPAHHRLKAAYGTSPRIVSEAQVARMFPRLDELWALHAALLARLRARQRTAPRVASVADILADTFAPPAHHRLKAAYGTSPRIVSEAQVARMFPRLDELWALHAALLARLRARQRTAPRVASVADILADTFAPPAHHRLKAAYGTSPRIVSEAQVARMFPRLDELWALHAALLARLRARQRTAPRVASVADILADTFAPPAHHRLKAAYGTSPCIVSPRVASVADILADTFAPPAHHRLKAAYGTSPCIVSPRVASVADILADTFAPPAHHRLKAAYGTSPCVVSPRVASVADILADTFAPPAHHRLKAAYGTSPCVVSPRVASVADILADTFAPPAHHRLKAAYGTSPCVVSPRVASVADILADTFAPPAHHRLKAAYGTSPRIVSEAQVARMFPRLDELWALHAALLARLRARQRTAPRVASVADILADTFAPPAHHRLKAAYGTSPRIVSEAQVARMFPRLDELWALHAALLARLRARQRTAPRVASVADILADTFAPPAHHRLKAAYGEFCARHRDAVEVFKECCAREPRLARFIRKCQQNPLLRKKGVPECVLFVAQRLTKYPLLLEPLLKTAGDDVTEREMLQKALCGVKEILVDVDNQVAAKEREDRKLEIYHRIDAKSFSNFRGRKFKKSDILQGNRSLKFEGVATLMQGRSKMQTLLVIVLTDVLFFLHDNNNKYTFFTPDNKTGVVSLWKLLVREKAGAEGRGLYLICNGPPEPEMFELRVHRPKDIALWIHAVRAAVQSCPEEVEESEVGVTATSAEERQRQLEARHENIRLITEALRAKDREHAQLLEEKMALHMKMVGHTGSSTLDVPNTASHAFPGGLVFPEYVRLAAPSPDTHALWQEVCKVVKEALEASSAGWSMWAGGGALGRSTSSAGERHSAAYQSPALPRRADTFAGFDAQQHRGVAVRLSASDTPTTEIGEGEGHREGDLQAKVFRDEADAALKLQHAIYTLACIVWQQLTTIHSLEAQVCAWRASGAGCAAGGGAARAHDAQLEELRHAQARLTAERAAWEAQRAADNDALERERRQLQAARKELEEQQKDVEQQRERLYRRLERLQQHGGSQEEIASVGTLSPDSSVSDTNRRKEPKWRTSRGSSSSESACAPPQLLSANNETRVAVRAPAQPVVKQQLPLKLASGKSQQPPPGYHRLHESPSEQNQGLVIHHTRTGSSPAPLPSQQQFNNNKATRTNTYPKLPDKFRVRAADAPAHPALPAHPPPAPEEEVIYF
ncbi:unnamed protein product [Euphydryas editha]|uniref:Uncharacterized protein n=1 Tax=Euphydryas editha TaxID=104508 RepID=A0AAU9UK07_EUPED|nr:unnamed protein product [Euphydryas editha]